MFSFTASRSLSLTLAHSRPLARALSTTAQAKMPLYLAYCPDYPDNLQTRLSVREAHLEAAGKDKETGASGESTLGWQRGFGR